MHVTWSLDDIKRFYKSLIWNEGNTFDLKYDNEIKIKTTRRTVVKALLSSSSLIVCDGAICYKHPSQYNNTR